MAEIGVGQWGVTLRISRRKSGYQWDSEGRLCPRSHLSEPGDPSAPHRIGAAIQQISDARACRDAFKGFVKIGREVEWGVERDGEDEFLLRQDIMFFANRFGTLYGGEGKHETLDDWLNESCKFMSLLDASRAARSSVGSRDVERFRNKIRRQNTDTGIWLMYESGRAYASVLPIAGGTDTMQPDGGALVDFTEIATKARAQELAMIMISNVMQARMVGALNFEPNRLDKGKFTVTPKNLISMLYLRLWLDTVQAPEAIRYCACGNEIQGTRSRQYCSDTCRQRYYRKRRSPT